MTTILGGGVSVFHPPFNLITNFSFHLIHLAINTYHKWIAQGRFEPMCFGNEIYFIIIISFIIIIRTTFTWVESRTTQLTSSKIWLKLTLGVKIRGTQCKKKLVLKIFQGTQRQHGWKFINTQINDAQIDLNINYRNHESTSTQINPNTNW